MKPALAEDGEGPFVLVTLVLASLEVPRVLRPGVEFLEVLASEPLVQGRLSDMASLPRANQGWFQAVLEEEQLQVAPRAVERAGDGEGVGAHGPRRLIKDLPAGARDGLAQLRRDPRQRRPGRRRRAPTPYSSQRSMVPLAVSILPAARETTSSGSLPPALAASTSSAASTAASAMPAHVTAVRIASRLKYGSRISSPGSPRTASTGAPSKTTRWLSEARIPAPLNQSVSICTPLERST